MDPALLLAGTDVVELAGVEFVGNLDHQKVAEGAPWQYPGRTRYTL